MLQCFPIDTSGSGFVRDTNAHALHNRRSLWRCGRKRVQLQLLSVLLISTPEQT